MTEQLAASPASSFPELMGRGAALKGFYRLLGHDAVTPDVLMEPYINQTRDRARAHQEILVIHDTSDVILPGEVMREGLGFINGSTDQGFLLHCSLAVTADGTRRPLGILASKTWVREKRKSRRADGRKRDGGDYHRAGPNEGDRWSQQCAKVEELLAGTVGAIHVMDREADAYAHFQAHLQSGRRFVVRMTHDRVINDEFGERDGTASEHLVRFAEKLRMEVPITRRRAKPMPGSATPRDARAAMLSVSSGRLKLRKPHYFSDDSSDVDVDVNVVCVVEVDAPSDADPITWVLVTSEPVTTVFDVLRVLEIYRTRWLIEEFFKALKTGCAIEKRQLDSYETLTNALALFLPIAAQMLLLRTLERTQKDADAIEVLTPTQIQVLRLTFPKLPTTLTVSIALRAIAELGGHFSKTAPGWLVIGRGMEKLLLLETGFVLGTAASGNVGKH